MLLRVTQQRYMKRYILRNYNVPRYGCGFRQVLDGEVHKEDHATYITTYLICGEDKIPQYHGYWSMYDYEYKKLLNRRCIK